MNRIKFTAVDTHGRSVRNIETGWVFKTIITDSVGVKKTSKFRFNNQTLITECVEKCDKIIKVRNDVQTITTFKLRDD